MPEKHAKYFRDKVVPAMVALREAGDALEGLVAAGSLAAADVPRDVVHQVVPRFNHSGPGVQQR